MTFPLALAVGIEGLDEVMELELAEELSADGVAAAHCAAGPGGPLLPRGRSVARGQPQGPSPNRFLRGPGSRGVEPASAGGSSASGPPPSWPVERDAGPGPLDLRPLLLELGLDQGVLRMRLRVDSLGSAGPRDVLRRWSSGRSSGRARGCAAPPWRSAHDASPPAAAAALLAPTACVLVGIAEQESENMKQEMLINVAQPEECRIAIVEDGMLEELYVERAGQDNYVGNIYKGVVVNLEPSIQAAFVDFGVGRNGFLHVSDIEPQYFRQGGYDPRKRGRPAPARAPRRNDRPPATSPTRACEDDGPRGRAPTASAAGPASSRPSRKSSAAATRCWCR